MITDYFHSNKGDASIPGTTGKTTSRQGRIHNTVPLEISYDDSGTFESATVPKRHNLMSISSIRHSMARHVPTVRFIAREYHSDYSPLFAILCSAKRLSASGIDILKKFASHRRLGVFIHNRGAHVHSSLRPYICAYSNG